ncbi:hypothetical protein [Desulfobacca acetoxidans]
MKTLKKVLTIILILLTLFVSSQAMAEYVVNPTGEPPIPLLKDDGSLAGIVLSGNKCSVIKKGNGAKNGFFQVKIMEGPGKGIIGWVPNEYVKKTVK